MQNPVGLKSANYQGGQVEEVRITITVENEEQAQQLLAVIEKGEVEGALDFAFEVHTDRVESK